MVYFLAIEDCRNDEKPNTAFQYHLFSKGTTAMVPGGGVSARVRGKKGR